MEQVITPNINTPSVAGMCQKYVDDAGGVPNSVPPRLGTAKAAYLQEQAAGRIRTDNFPKDVWLIVWFSFSKGSYTYPNGTTIYYKDAWHVAWLRRTGDRIEIHDSEVHRGARKPYTSLLEVEAWFAAYGAKYAGWSASCSGRTYAISKENSDVIMDNEHLNSLFNAYIGRYALNEEAAQFVGKMEYGRMIEILDGSKERSWATTTIKNLQDQLKQAQAGKPLDKAKVDKAIKEAQEALDAAKALQ